MKLKYQVILVLLVSGITYLNTLTNKFVAEDYYLITGNDFIKNWDNIGLLFNKKNLLKPAQIRNGARPLTLLSLMVDHKVWELRPIGYHLTNVALHMFNCALVFYLFCFLGLPPDYSLLTAIIYSIHPIQGEVVNVPGFRADLLVSMFFLIGLMLYIAMVEKKQYAYLIPAVVSYLFALMSKEIAFVLPIVFLLYLVIYRKHDKKGIVALSFLPLFILGSMYLLFFWIERYSYDIFKGIFVVTDASQGPFESLTGYINTIGITFYHYIKNLFIPISLSYEYQLNITGDFSVRATAGILLLMMMLILSYRTKDRILKFSIGMFFLTFLAVSNIVPLFNTVADRYMYLPLVGFAYVMLFAGKAVFTSIKTIFERFFTLKHKPVLNIQFFLTMIILSFYLGITFNRNYVFKNMLNLYSEALDRSPDNPRVRYNMALAFKERKALKASNHQFMELIKLNKTYKAAEVWELMGQNYQMMGNFKKARECYVKLILLKKRTKDSDEKSWKSG